MHLNTLYGAGTVASLLVLLLVFNLGKKLTGFQAAVLTTWTVLVFCVFKRNGNYIFPYTYSAVYGTLLGLGALAAQIRYIDGRRSRALTLSGVLAGLAFICKLEFGFAATAGLVAVAFSERPGARLRTPDPGALACAGDSSRRLFRPAVDGAVGQARQRYVSVAG